MDKIKLYDAIAYAAGEAKIGDEVTNPAMTKVVFQNQGPETHKERMERKKFEQRTRKPNSIPPCMRGKTTLDPWRRGG